MSGKHEKAFVAFDARIKQFFTREYESETGTRSVHPAVSKWQRTDYAWSLQPTTAAVDDAMSEADRPEQEVRIRAQAYQLWEGAGRPEGQSDYFWYRAEDLILLKELDQETASAFVVLLGVVFSAAFLCIDHISEIAATTTSRSIKVREASDALTGLKKLAGLTGEAIINLDSKVGTLGRDPAAERDCRKQQVFDVLRSLNLDQQSLKEVASGRREHDLIDYTGDCELCSIPRTAARRTSSG